MTYTGDEERWRAVLSRDPRADGKFLYGVRTTGVYCRPTCSSRRPARKNVLFFSGCEEAERAGFRPCKRCVPNEASARVHNVDAVVRACKLMEESTEIPGLDALAGAVGASPSHLHRLFKELLGVTPKEYASMLRMDRVRKGLARGAPVTDAIYDAGFNSGSRFYENASSALGMTAGAFKHGGEGMRIRYALAQSFLGRVLVAATDRGICAIDVGDSDEVLVRDLRARFARAELSRDDPELGRWVSQVVAFMEAPSETLDVPLDIQGTAFQRRVWSALQAIPPGSVRTYTEVAREIGKPKAVRAVAHACASNRIAAVVPCHRVLRVDGGLGGYRWGLHRKQSLLRLEATEAAHPKGVPQATTREESV